MPTQQVAALPPVMTAPKLVDPPESGNAPIASFSRHNGGWTVVFSIADPTLGISWRLGENGDFKETGFIDALDPRTRKRIPNSSVQLDPDTPAQTHLRPLRRYQRRPEGAVSRSASIPKRRCCATSARSST